MRLKLLFSLVVLFPIFRLCSDAQTTRSGSVTPGQPIVSVSGALSPERPITPPGGGGPPSGPPAVQCTGVSGGTPTTSGGCSGMTFTWNYTITYSNNSSATQVFSSSPAKGVCAVDYPTCQGGITSVPEQLPQISSGALNLNLNTQSMVFSYDIQQFGIQETGECQCTDTDSSGFYFLSPSSPPDVTGQIYASC